MLCIVVFVYLIHDLNLDLILFMPLLGVLALSAQKLLPILQQAYGAWSALKSGEASFAIAIEMLEQEIDDNGLLNKLDLIKFNHDILFDRVSFSYGPKFNKTIDNLTVKINRGDRVGVIGKTGSGKSTFADLLMGLLEPQSGAILVDGIVLNKANYDQWRLNIAHVSQNIFLADATIRENITIGYPTHQIDENRLMDVISRAQLTDFLNGSVHGLDTPVGERGIKLSGGQKQRIGIARALYKNAQLIIFDEATSALDSSTESELMHAIESLPKEITLIMIAHRVSTLKNCNRFFSFNAGALNEVTHL